MELTIPIIFDSLLQFQPQLLRNCKNSQNINSVRLLNESAAEFDNRYLYVTDNPQIFGAQHNLPTNILFIGQIKQEIGESNLIALDCSKNVLQIFEFVQQVFENYEKWNSHLTEAILRNDSLQTIVDIAASQLTNPIALFDSTSTLLHKSGDFKKSYSNTIWESVIASGYSPLEFYSVQEQNEIARRLSEDPSPFLFRPFRAGNHTHLTAPIIINSKPHGVFGMVDINEPFTEGQLSVVAHIKKLMEFALSRSIEFLPITEEYTCYINRLLSGFNVEEKIINYHLSQRGWTIADTYYLLNFSFPLKTDDLIINNSYMKKIGLSFPKALVCSYEHSIIAIVRKRDYAVLMDYWQNVLEILLHRYDMKCGISTEFFSFLDLKYYYIQTQYALLEGLSQNEEDGIYQYMDYYKSHIIHTLDNATSLKELCHPKILHMWRSGNPSQQELVRCLYIYMLYGKNITDTAKALFIHRNTLTYRLERLSELLELDFSSINSDTLFYLLVSCMLLIDYKPLKSNETVTLPET